MKTQLNNLLAQKKKRKELKSYSVSFKDNIISSSHPPSRYATCHVSIILNDNTPYEILMDSVPFGNKKDTERYVSYHCYNQIISDLDKKYAEPICNFGNTSVMKELELYASDDEDIVYVSSSSKTPSKSPQLYPLLPVVLPKEYHNGFLYILCDIENKPNTDTIEKYMDNFDNVIVLKFISKNNPNRNKGNIIVNSSYNDASDHAISMYIGGILQSVKIPVEIIVYTGDRFASGLQEFCSFDSLEIHHNVHHMAHSEDIIKFINEQSHSTIENGKQVINIV